MLNERAVNILTNGRHGENVVHDYHMYQGYHVVMSTDQYDQVKDMTINGKTAEVKTLFPMQRVLKEGKSFSIPRNQWRKIDGVDLFFFVEVPDIGCPYINIYECIDRKKYQTVTFNSGAICRQYLLTDQKLLCKIYNPKLALELSSRSPSNYKTKWKESA